MGFARREVEWRPLLRLAVRRREAVILGLGVLFRVAQYLANRSLWMDESSLGHNIEHKTLAGLFGPLDHVQLAPPGFLAVEWAASRTLGNSTLSLRLFPLACGIASLFLFREAAARCLRPSAVWVALAMFAVSDDLIYFSSELKQYATDAAAALACLLAGLAMSDRAASPRNLAAFAAAGAAIVWFSHPSAFVLAGVGAVLIASALRRRAWGRARGLSAACLAWAASFAGVYAVSREQLGHRDAMWAFWAFAFPRVPPATAWDASWVLRRLYYLFVNPLDFYWPLGPRLSPLPAMACFAAGCASLWRRDAGRLGMLLLPVLLALGASYLRLYPFHGRLLLFLVPSLLLVIGEGAGRVAEMDERPGLRAALLAVLLLLPTANAFLGLVQPRDRLGAHYVGDRRPGSIDPDKFPM